jgi:hypothetical protein
LIESPTVSAGARFLHHAKGTLDEGRRRAVMALQEPFGVSRPRACQVVGQQRSTQRLSAPVIGDDEQALRAWLIASSGRR